MVAAVCGFESLADAANAVAVMKLSEIPMVRCELLDATSVAAFNQSLSADTSGGGGDGGGTIMEERPTLFLEFQGPSRASVEEQLRSTQTICADFGGSGFEHKSSEDDRRALWAARHGLYYAAIHHLRENTTTAVLTDACVPLSRFADAIAETVRDVADAGLVGPCFGHAGDGNFHCILPITDDEDEDYLSRVMAVQDRIVRRALEAGGTCTGEHGVGYGKIKYLKDQFGPGAVRTMELVKRGLDPNNILNPGKVVVVPVANE